MIPRAVMVRGDFQMAEYSTSFSEGGALQFSEENVRDLVNCCG